MAEGQEAWKTEARGPAAERPKLSDHWPTVTLDGKETVKQPESNKAAERDSGSLERVVRCRDCKHWKTPHPEYGATYDRNQPPDNGWWDGVCKRLQYGITITASGGWDGATVDSVETDGNFACIYGETPNDKDLARRALDSE